MAKLPHIDSVKQHSMLINEYYDWEYCKYLALSKGVVGIPSSAFLSEKSSIHDLGPMARFAFCKKDSTLVDASVRLARNYAESALSNING
jgi:aspartate/methionine/tyrosine aminotransferase